MRLLSGFFFSLSLSFRLVLFVCSSSLRARWIFLFSRASRERKAGEREREISRRATGVSSADRVLPLLGTCFFFSAEEKGFGLLFACVCVCLGRFFFLATMKRERVGLLVSPGRVCLRLCGERGMFARCSFFLANLHVSFIH